MKPIYVNASNILSRLKDGHANRCMAEVKQGSQKITTIFFRKIALTCLSAIFLTPAIVQAQSPASSNNCAWPYLATSTTLNVAYPDTNAKYWTMPYSATSNTKLIVRGEFLKARFLSVSTYDQKGSPIDSIADKDFLTVKGTNPYDPDHDSSKINTFEVTIVPKASASNTGSESALPPGSIYGVSPTGKLPAQGFLIFRIYIDGEPNGGTKQNQLPLVIADNGGRKNVFLPCQTAQSPSTQADTQSQNDLSLGSRNLPETLFFPPQSPVNRHFPNLFNAYLVALVRYQAGRIVVIRGKAPTPPETSPEGYPLPGRGEQMRYWSFCNNENVLPFPVIQCQKDVDIKLDGEGYYTLIIAGSNDVPSNALKDEAITLLPFSSEQVQNAVLLRNMLPISGFLNTAQTANSACEGEPTARSSARCAEQQMQEYYPVATYCSKQQYESGGWKSCFHNETGTGM